MIRNEFHEVLADVPPEGWTRGHVSLHLRFPDERVSVEAWRRGAFAVHRVNESGANLTHAPTGFRIWTFRDLNSAAAAAAEMESLTDWNAIVDEMPRDSDLYPLVRAIIDRIEGAQHGED
jgi:hypothetical protein